MLDWECITDKNYLMVEWTLTDFTVEAGEPVGTVAAVRLPAVGVTGALALVLAHSRSGTVCDWKGNRRLTGLDKVILLWTSYCDCDIAIIKRHILSIKFKTIATIQLFRETSMLYKHYVHTSFAILLCIHYVHVHKTYTGGL